MSEEKKVSVAEVVEAKVPVQEQKKPVAMEPNLERDAKLKVGVIGVGNAGNQTVSKLYKAGYRDNLLAINTSVRDLSDEIVAELIPSWIAGRDGRGAGKNRDKAMKLFKENGQDLFSRNTFTSMLDKCDVIIIVYALGGGTGSYIGPALCGLLSKMIQGTKKTVISYSFYPKLADSPQSHYNSLKAINEVNAINIPMLIDDLSELENVPAAEAYDKVANNFIEYYKTINGIYCTTSGNGMMDENDMMTLISYPGYQAHYHIKDISADKLEDRTMQSYMISEIKKSPCMNIQKDGQIEHIGIIANYPTSLREKSKSGDYSELQDYIGNRARTLFENYGEVNTPMASMHVVMSGLTLPWDKVARSEAIVKEYGEKKQKSGAQVDLDGVIASLGDTMESESVIQGGDKINKDAAKAALSSFFN